MRSIPILLSLAALTYVFRVVDAPAPHGVEAAMMLGFVLLASYLAGDAAAAARLPRLTGYVLLGIVIGPFVGGILSAEMVGSLRLIDEIALALIALTAGGELKIGPLRRSLRDILLISLGVMLVVTVGIALLVVGARPFVGFLAERPIGFALALALFLGLWSSNSSPDATIAVINETGAHGRVTETILGITILKDVLVIISLAAALSIAAPLVEPQASFDAGLLGQVAWEVGGAGVVGGLAGWGFAWYLERIGARGVLATLVFTYILTLLASGLHVELLLTAVAAGFVIENFSAAGEAMIHGIEANALVVFAIFFALAGAALDLGALVEFWPAALAIVAARAALTWLGARAGARLARADDQIRRLAWMGLISQAGVTLGLAVLVGRRFPGWGDRFVAVAGAAIIFHLLLGPILLKIALARAGEARPRRSTGAAVRRVPA